MTVLTTILNGSSGKDVRDTLNQLLSTVAALTGSTALAITGTPAGATQNVAYSYTPAVSGGTGGTKTFTLTGTLLAGLSFNTTTGRISGTPTATGTMTGLKIAVTDGTYSVSQTFNLTVAAAAAARTTFPTPSGGSILYAMDPDQITGADGSRVTTHTDPLSSIVATAPGTGPLLVKNAYNGHAALRFASNHAERLNIGRPASIVSACATNANWSMIIVLRSPSSTSNLACPFGDDYSNGTFTVAYTGGVGLSNGNVMPASKFAGDTPTSGVKTLVYSGQTIGGTIGRRYVNGLMTGNNGTKLGGTAYDILIGSGQNNGTGGFPYGGDILGIYIMSGVLTAPEALQAHLWACNKFGDASPLAGRSVFYLFDGDSITYGIAPAGADMSSSFPSQLAIKRGWKIGQWANVGKPGGTVASTGTNANTMMDQAARDVDGFADVTGLPVVLVSGEYYNQGGSSGTTADGATLANNNRTYATTRKATGKIAYHHGWTSTASQLRNGPRRDGFNTSLMNALGDFNSMSPMHLDPYVGVDAQGIDTNYVFDGTHMSPAGYLAMANVIDAGLTNAGYAS